MKRRDFIYNSMAATALLSSSSLLSCSSSAKKLKILVLGGTFFVGPAIVRAAINKNHEVTLFNRGKTNPGLFPDLRLIKGDRESGKQAYNPLLEEKWDVIIDVWPEKSQLVDEATETLKDHCDHYVFISSIAVYNNFQEVGLHEGSEVVSLDLAKEEWTYSEEKLAAENFVRKRFQGKHTILRPGAIKGWRDPALDLYYWCLKLKRDHSIIAPGSGKDPLQFIDVKDVGRFSIMAAENKFSGSFNVVGPRKKSLLWDEFLEICKQHFDSDTNLIWANETFLSENEVYSFSDLPLWAPLSEDEGFMQISNQKLTETGFVFTPIESTLDECFRWHQTQEDKAIKFGSEEVELGLDRERELRLMELFKK